MKLRTFLKCILRTTAALGLTAVSTASEPLVTNVSRFEIPFDVDALPGQPTEGFAVLFGSSNGGATWEKLQTVPVAQKGFPFVAPRDGHYGFAVRRTDAAGNLQVPRSGSIPELEIVVDTTPPELHLTLESAGPGQATIRWHAPDASADLTSLTIEYLDATDGRWKPARVTPSASGQTLISATPGSVISARATLLDTAGNQADVSEQLVIPSRPPAGFPGPAPDVAAPLNAVSIGPSPFAGQGSAAPPTFAPRVPNPSVTAAPAVSGPAATYPVVPSTPAGPTTSIPGLPVADSQAPVVQLLNHRVFDLAYQVEDVGPSGVSAVEIFVTEDGGQQWFRYGNDTDMRSPAKIDVQGEGTFGFAIRVRSGLGLINVPPQPGERPDIVITVDESAPVLEFQQPVIRADGMGVVVMQWNVTDANPVAAPVRLEKSTSPTGPWSPVFDWRVDQGQHEWAVEPGTPATLYFRLLARDAAGNVASATTPQPVLIDLNRPVARVIGAQVSMTDGKTSGL